MTSYIVQARYVGAPELWNGDYRYATREEAEANVNDIIKRRGPDSVMEDLLETRIVESPRPPMRRSTFSRR